MERIYALIDKLNQQKQQNSHPAQLLLTVQLLQSELLKLTQRNGTLGTAKVAVTLPVNMNFSEEVVRAPKTEKPEPIAVREEPVAAMPEPQPVAGIPQQQPVAEALPEQKEYSLRRPVVTEEQETLPVSPYAPRPQLMNPAFSETVETPTLVQHQTRRELHEVIAEKKESLNDRLKEDKKELVHALKETPIKDLRKGIGINDRFTFVNELFRGDEAMYERSIKTINGFHIYSEAEYWINRELRLKLGWDESKEVVQHFYHLVKRRFS